MTGAIKIPPGLEARIQRLAELEFPGGAAPAELRSRRRLIEIAILQLGIDALEARAAEHGAVPEMAEQDRKTKREAKAKSP